EGGGDVDVEVGVDASGDLVCQGGHGSSLLSLGGGAPSRPGRADKTTTGLLDRLPVGHFARPVGTSGAEWVTGPGRQINPRTTLEDESVSRYIWGQTWPGHPPGPWSPSPPEWWIPGPLDHRCRVPMAAYL